MSMTKRLAKFALAMALVAFVGIFAMEAAGHWHANSYDEQHCQVCHLGHVSVPQPAANVRVQKPVPVARFAPAETPVPVLEAFRTNKIPRAPPA
jgi:hypothetical protein